MLNTSEAETAEQLITDYSDIGQHTKKTTLPNGQARKISHKNELGEDTEKIISPEQRMTIMKQVRTFACDGLKITNYIFKRDHVDICYLFEGTRVAHNTDELRQQLADHLKINSEMIKMTKLRAKPIYKETTLRPGETVHIHPESFCKIGSFVEVEGKGNHALMSGHGKISGDVLLHPNGDRLGVVNVSLNQPQQPIDQDAWFSYRDVALAKLEKQDQYIAKVRNGVHGQLHLMEEPVEAKEGMKVRCFATNGKRGRVDSTAYIRQDELQINWRLISINNEADEPVHGEGESGILIAGDTAHQGGVEAVGMLVGIDELPLDDEDKTTRRTSLAVPLTTSFKALQKDDYCKELAIKFLQ